MIHKTRDNENLQGRDLSNQNLAFIEFKHCNLTQTSLSGTDLRFAHFIDCIIFHTDLTGANLNYSQPCRPPKGIDTCLIDQDTQLNKLWMQSLIPNEEQRGLFYTLKEDWHGPLYELLNIAETLHNS